MTRRTRSTTRRTLSKKRVSACAEIQLGRQDNSVTHAVKTIGTFFACDDRIMFKDLDSADDKASEAFYQRD